MSLCQMSSVQRKMSDNSYKKVVAKNRRASFDYSIEENIEAGIMLTGSELKSIREGKVSLADSHAAEGSGELYLYNCHIAEYEKANRFNHAPLRPRKLLLRKKEMQKITINNTKKTAYEKVIHKKKKQQL